MTQICLNDTARVAVSRYDNRLARCRGYRLAVILNLRSAESLLVAVTMHLFRNDPLERATPLTPTAHSSTAHDPPACGMTLSRTSGSMRHSLRGCVLKGCGAFALPLMLSACSWSWFGLNHSTAAHTQTHPSGWLSVAPARDFAYMPARSGRVSANRIENTAMTGIVLKDDVNEAVRNSVANRLQVAGFHLNQGTRVLSGNIEKFFVDDTRSPAYWTLQMRYVVTDVATRKVVYSATKTVREKSPKFTNTQVAIEDTVRASVDALIADGGFLGAVK